MSAYFSNHTPRRPGHCIRMLLGLAAAAISLQAGALPVLSSESYSPVLWGPAAVSSQFVQYSVQVSSSGSSADQQFLNVVRSDGSWVVQNLPVGFEPGTSAVATNIDSTLFATGSTYQTTLSATPVNAAPAFSSGLAQNLAASVNYLFNDGLGETDAGAFVKPGDPSNIALNFGPVLMLSYHTGVPDLAQGPNECVPTATANSLTWLNDTYGLGLTQTTAQIRDILKDNNHMKTDPASGTVLQNFFDGKEKFVAENNLRIVTHVIGGGPGGRPGVANILEELKKGQDVELRVDWKDGGAHRITVVGLVDLGILGAGFWFNDPDDNQTQTNWSWLDTNPDGTLTVRSYGATNGGNTVKLGVAESVPEPGSLALVFLGMLALVRFHASRAARVA